MILENKRTEKEAAQKATEEHPQNRGVQLPVSNRQDDIFGPGPVGAGGEPKMSQAALPINRGNDVFGPGPVQF